MGVFRIPYRWMPSTVWPNIKSCFEDVYYGIKNIVRWTPVIWHDHDFDWAYLAEIMEYKLRRLSNLMEHGYHSGGKREARRALTCAILLKRMYEDCYWKRNPGNIEGAASLDQELCFKLMGKHFRKWWE